ncbi:type II toxin-antitoxin system prevent-host-death family antitoxin [Enterococcus cecorum]|uniref:type II toxin-antitoxin system prevent-host-death family antitoxin n=1 Tax=Enterococcus cecorum TaxID=44008 RepID=UPI001FADA1F5|nr:type II toxin-antitoxin system prevent-host-death family antitoxin [Enterococcus cecorum]MCJ0595105.1 type II toxin-antitoxin system prevent-host-death family antitoxin [Enterococcus cecorum]
MKKVNDDVQRVVVTTNDESDIEVMGKAVYDSWQETLYLSKEYQRIRRVMWIANHFVLNTKICFAKYDKMLYHYVTYCKKFLN